jgi:hypothetical protein
MMMAKASGKAAQCNAAQHQPGLVAVPYGRNRVHHELRDLVSGMKLS